MRKEKFDPNTFVRRSQLKALRRNVDNERQKKQQRKAEVKKLILRIGLKGVKRVNVCNNS